MVVSLNCGYKISLSGVPNISTVVKKNMIGMLN